MAAHAKSKGEPASGHGLFTTTRWSMVLRAQAGSETALNSLFEMYRAPLVVWLRARGSTPHDAEDLVQGFCATLLRRDFLTFVDQGKGKFRTFLLTSLKHYLCDEWDRQRAAKRGAGQAPVPLPYPDEQSPSEPASSDAGPDREFDRAWWRAIQSAALRQLETESARTGHGPLCVALEPVLFADETAPSYREIAEQLGMTEGAVRTAAHRIRARLKGIFREIVLQTVGSKEALQEELRYLASLFAA